MDTTDELLALEHEGWRALCEGTGDRFYGELMTEDGVMVLADGSVLDREAVVASLDQAPTWDTYELSDVRRVDTGPDSAALVYTGRAVRGPEPPFLARMASTYRRAEGQWRLVLYQQTPAPQ